MKLHGEAASPELVKLLMRLMGWAGLSAFQLGGGTALALRFGHRISVDIDLFTSEPFDADFAGSGLVAGLSLSDAAIEEGSISGSIEGIKIDCLAHRYALIKPMEEVDGIRFLATEDIAAMKLDAVAIRGSKKDFWDIDELLRHFSRDELFEFFSRKYPASSLWQVEKSLSYFDDADGDPDPRCLRGLSWDAVKARIRKSNRI